MDQIILGVIAMVALCWGVRVMPWETVTACVAPPRASRCVACRTGADWVVERNRPMSRTAAAPDR